MSLTVNIVNLENNSGNLKLVNGLTLDDMKTKYNWIFNATILNAVIGEDSNGLVWYMGDWLCGEWRNGTWYSGTFHDGVWDNGTWYSYKIDEYQILNNNMIILDRNNTYSKFLNGHWMVGTFYGGTFGDVVSGVTDSYYTRDIILSGVGYATWYDGDFMNGIFQNSVWRDGNFFNGTFSYSQWLSGNVMNGQFSYNVWWTGSWYGGDFITGIWKNGYFTIRDSTILSRFGYNTISDSGITTEWYDGVFENGLFYSGYKIINSGISQKATYGKASVSRTITTSTSKQLELDNLGLSNNHNRTHWYGGIFRNGYWYGGTWENGLFENGVWYNGVFSGSTVTGATWKDGEWYDGLWIYGTFKGGYWYGGMWLGGNFEGGKMMS